MFLNTLKGKQFSKYIENYTIELINYNAVALSIQNDERRRVIKSFRLALVDR